MVFIYIVMCMDKLAYLFDVYEQDFFLFLLVWVLYMSKLFKEQIVYSCKYKYVFNKQLGIQKSNNPQNHN
jgi:hypothetical protein